jgi:iron-sulfur cluster repair protein YtfE (RIC family)
MSDWSADDEKGQLMVGIDVRPTGAMRVKHGELRREASHLARVGGTLAEWSAPDVPDQLTAIRGFLYGRLLPHAEAEDAILYPLMDKVMGAQQATATMTADHREIHRRAHALAELIAAVGFGPPTGPQKEALREHLYALWAIVDLHLDKEETILFQLLDERLSAIDVKTLGDKMEAFLGGPFSPATPASTMKPAGASS